MGGLPELIVMLTHHDRTVPNAIEVFEAAREAPARYWGFKEEGLPMDKMKTLVQMMKDAGKVTFLEVVAYTEAECLVGAKMGVECGFDILMGTFYFDSIRDLTKAAGTKYMPFVGEIYDRPSILDGTIDGMIEQAHSLLKKGVDGFDLLAYRYTGDPELLAAQFVKSVPAPVCVAGSIQSFQRLDKVKEIAPWTFTIGSAFFEHKFGEDFAEEIKTVCDYMKR